MACAEGKTTNPSLLRRAADWQDGSAWYGIMEQYRPLLRLWSRRYRLDEHAADEVCQSVWIALAGAMPKFRYRSDGRFRGWLWLLFRSRVVDFQRKQRASRLRLLDDLPIDVAQFLLILDEPIDEAPEGPPDLELDALVRVARESQEAVRRHVAPETWQAFELIELHSMTGKDAARAVGKSQGAVHAAWKRVIRHLREEGRRRLAEFQEGHPEFGVGDGSTAGP